MSDDHGYHHGPHDWSHGAPHNSWAPLIMSIGAGLFLFGFAKTFTMNEGMNGYIYDSAPLSMTIIGLAIMFAGLITWWKQDMSFDGSYEPQATEGSSPFANIDIRKVAMWVFLMSEMMIFTSLFSTYMRYRIGLENCGDVFASGNWVEGSPVVCFEPASHLIASSWFHLAPGAINTFALILSSFTIVQALRWAKKPRGSVDEEVRRKRITRYLGTTWVLAALFITLKMVEWFLGFPLPEFLHEYNHGHAAIDSLYSEGYLINNDHYQHHSYVDEATQAHMMADIQVSATTFYVTTGTHGAHVLGGVVGLTYMTYKAHTGGYTPDNAVSIEYFGLYWHFVDLVWVLVFPFFYLY